MSNINQIYYFLIGDYHKKSELGYYLCEDNSISEKDKQYIISKVTETYSNFDEKDIGSKECKVLDNNIFSMFHLITSSGTFYLSIVSIHSVYMDQNNLMFEFFEDIEHQGIKKLIDNNTGKLSRVGIQNLKFSIENNNNKMRNVISEGNDRNKIKHLNTQINDINNEMKNSVKNMIVSVNEMNNLNSKSVEIKDMSEKFQQGAYDVEKKMRRKNCLFKIALGIIAIIIIFIVIKFIF